MALSFVELQDEALHDDFDPTKYRPKVKRYLNEAAGRIRRRLRLPEAEEVHELTLVAGTATYALPADQIRLASVHLSDPYVELEEADSDDINPAATGAGQPSRFAVRGNTLIVSPVPSASGTLLLQHWSRGTRMVADGDMPGIPEDYEDLLVTYTRARLLRAEDDFEAAGVYMAEFKTELAEARADLQRRTRNRARQVPGTWARRPGGPRFVRP